jgi:hypothetical protein
MRMPRLEMYRSQSLTPFARPFAAPFALVPLD